jgi:hypothetical protein
MQPVARKDNLVVEEIWDEVVVYDRSDNQVHRLNRSAATVWRHCDGTRTPADLAAVLHKELGLPLDEAVAEVALEELSEANLLTEPFAVPVAAGAMSRREMFEKLAVAAYMVPLVASVLAIPSTAAASTPTSPDIGASGPVTPKSGNYTGSATRGSASCGNFSASETFTCSMNSSLTQCTITEAGSTIPRVSTGAVVGIGTVLPIGTYSGSGLLFGSTSGSWAVICSWTSNTTMTVSESITVPGQSGCPALYTGTCHQ